MTDFDEKFNIILLGDIKVGKTSLILRFADKEFSEELQEIEQKQRDLTIDDKTCRIILTDTAGQERFRTLTSSFFRNAHAMIFVYDITNAETFEHVSGHFQDGTRYTKRALRVLVGNKTDLSKQRAVTEEQGRELANQLEVEFVEVSAKSGENVEDLFNQVAAVLLDRAQQDYPEQQEGRANRGKKNCVIS